MSGRSGVSARVRLDTRAAASGMTLVELILVFVLVGAGLFLLNGWLEGLRADAKKQLAASMLTKLDQALARYHRATGGYPPTPPPDPLRNAIVQLLNHQRTRPILESFPESLRREPATLVDPWGTPLRYLSAEPVGRPVSDYVRANGGRPVFVSAGPDRRFGPIGVAGDDDPADLGDNLRSDDPGPDGFWPHQAMRDWEPD